MKTNRQNIDRTQSELVTWLAKHMFTAYPEEFSGLKFYFLDCYCIYYQRVFRNADLDQQVGRYREPSDGPCQICMAQEGKWQDRVVDEMVVYSSKFGIEKV
jgi:hypothetical protein